MTPANVPTLLDIVSDGKTFAIVERAIRAEADVVEVEPVKLTEVTLRGASIATVQVTDLITKIVIFRPSKMTHKKVQAFEDELDIDLCIEDANGLFRSPRQVMITDFVYEAGNDTMIVTTEVQS